MTYLNRFAPSGHAICQNLRCKEMYYQCASHLETKQPVESEEDDRHVYWCVKTATALGADHKLATLDACSPDRDCYQP